jgi:hypothetical protein
MPPREFPTDLAGADISDAAFPSRKAAPSETPSTQDLGNSRHHYRITVDKLDPLKPGEEGLESVSFFAATSSDILAAANNLRERAGYSASDAAKLALALSLLNSAVPKHSGLVALAPLLDAAGELLNSREPIAAEAAVR